MNTPAPNMPTLESCRNIRPAGLISVSQGPLAGTMLPIFEMTSDPTPHVDEDSNSNEA